MQTTIKRGDAQEENTREVQNLMHTMLNADTYTGLQAINALGAIGAPAVGPLMRALFVAGSDARWTVAMALARIGAPAVDPLIGVVLAADDDLKNPAIWALAEIGDPRAVNPLIDTLRTIQPEICRILTAAALLKLGDPAGVAEVQRTFEREGEPFTGLTMEALEGT